MIKFLYIILISSFLGFLTFQVSQNHLPTISKASSPEIQFSDSVLLSADKIKPVSIEKDDEQEVVELVDEEEIYYSSGDASIQTLYAILQFVWKLYE